MRRDTWQSKRRTKQACAVVLVCLVIGFAWGSGSAQTSKKPPQKEVLESWTVRVPNVVGMMENNARDTLNRIGLRPQRGKLVEADTLDQHGVIYRQSEAPGTDITNGSIVTYDVYNFVRNAVPNVVGLSVDTAKGKLLQLGFGMNYGQKVPTQDRAKDYTVASQNPLPGDRPVKKIGVLVNYYVYSAPPKTERNILEKKMIP